MNDQEYEEYIDSEEFLTEIGRRIRELRKEKGVSIEQAHMALGVPRSTYASWELGHRKPRNKSLIALTNYLGTTTDYLMQKTDTKHPISDEKDLHELLTNVDGLQWNGKQLTTDQSKMITDLINVYLKNQQ